MSECKYARQLGAYHDGELPPAQAAEVEQHARQCPACAAELARIRALSAMLKSAPKPQLPPDVLARLHGRVDLMPAATISKWAEALAAIAAVVLLTCSILLATVSDGAAEATPEPWDTAFLSQTTESSESSAATLEQLHQWMAQNVSREDAHD